MNSRTWWRRRGWGDGGCGGGHDGGRTLVVDDDGDADFASIQAAVDAASDADITFVRDGCPRMWMWTSSSC